MQMIDEDIEMLEGSLRILRKMYGDLKELDIERASKGICDLDERTRKLYARKDGKDTRFFDIIAENSISLGTTSYGHYSLFQRVYSQSGVVITEERGRVPSDRRIEHNTPVIISDPVDKSAYLERIIKRHNGYNTMGELFQAEKERIGEQHARVEACNSSVTLLKDNTIKYSVILNLFTGETFIACEPGVFQTHIEEVTEISDLIDPVVFKTTESHKMLCWTKEGKYENNRTGTHLRFFELDNTVESPGGPNRFTYLLEDKSETYQNDIGIIAHNGEKIQEILPNIAVAYFSKGDLQAYKLFCDRNYNEHRAGKVMTPNLQNSLYNQGLIEDVGIKLEFLNNHGYPSEFRDTTIIIPATNEYALTLMEGMVKKHSAIRIV